MITQPFASDVPRCYARYLAFFHEEIDRLGVMETIQEYVFSPKAVSRSSRIPVDADRLHRIGKVGRHRCSSGSTVAFIIRLYTSVSDWNSRIDFWWQRGERVAYGLRIMAHHWLDWRKRVSTGWIYSASCSLRSFHKTFTRA